VDQSLGLPHQKKRSRTSCGTGPPSAVKLAASIGVDGWTRSISGRCCKENFDSGFSTPVERPYVSGVRVDVEASGRGRPSEGRCETPACPAEVGVARGGCFHGPPGTPPRSRSSHRGGPGISVTHRLGSGIDRPRCDLPDYRRALRRRPGGARSVHPATGGHRG